MAECEHLARTTAYFDGGLAAADEPAAIEHLATCAQCQRALGDAVAIDAVLSTVPRGAAVAPARRRWPIVVALAGAVAVAASAIVIVRGSGSGARTPQVAIELPRERAVEARFAGAQFAAHRPLAVLRGDRAKEPISLATLAELERRGDPRALIAALAASGDVGRARDLAAALPADAAADSDRAAIALAEQQPERALEHATRAVDRDPQLAAAWWNLGLAARDLRLFRVARAAIARVEARGEPGWADEARVQLAALDRELAPEVAFADFDARARAMVDGGAPITVEDVRRFPAFARVYVIDATRVAAGAELERLRPLADELDAQSGTPLIAAALARAAAADPAVRAAFAPRYRAVVARTATADELATLVADLRAAGPGVADLLASTIILGGQTTAMFPLLRTTVAPWGDPWFDLVVERADLRMRYPGRDLRAQPLLAAAHARCPAWASVRCGQLAQDLAQLLFDTGRTHEAEVWARRAVDAYVRAVAPVHVATARALLGDIHRNLGRNARARAELDEVVRAEPGCALERFARVLQADLAFAAGDWEGVRAGLPPAVPPPACGSNIELQALATATDLARRTGDPRDRVRAEAWIAAARAGRDPDREGFALIATARLAPGADGAPVMAWLAANPATADAARRQGVRAWGFTTLIADAGARGDWAGVLAAADLERHAGPPAPCTVVASVDDGAITVAARTPTGTLGEHRRVEPSALASTTIVPATITQALATCTGVALVARPPLHGRGDLLPPALPWWFAGDAPARSPGSPVRAIEVTSPRPPEIELPALPPPGPSTQPFAQSLTGTDATPSRVLAALATATYAELHVHGIASAHDDDATYLALSPDADGTFALRAGAVRRAKLAKAPLVVLAACRAAAVAPSLRERWSLPDAFLAAGASAVVAVDVAIPDASARAIFDELHRRVAAGEPVERALAAIRQAAGPDAAWARRLVVFR